MPPVRWKKWFTVMAILVQAVFVTDAQQMQDAISMSSDGWRPIVGSRRQPQKSKQVIDVIQADVVNIETTTFPLPQSSPSAQNIHSRNSAGFNKLIKQEVKAKNRLKSTNSYYTITPGSHGSPIPIGSNQQLKKTQGVKKTLVYGKPRKPMRGQALAHSSRNEIFIPPPPPNTGSYSFVKSVSPNNIKIREAQGFGLIGGNFGINPQNTRIELNRYPLTGESILQRPTFLFAKPLQNDEFTKNLVPPPRLQQQNKDSTHKISLYAFKEGPAVDASSGFPQFGPKLNQFAPQVSPSFDFSVQQQPQQQKQQQKSQKAKEQAVEVQVTKENLKQFSQNGPATFIQTAPGTFSAFSPGRNNFPIGYVDYDFQVPKARPQNLQNTLTYEVTEGKWLDTPSQQYRFRQQNTFIPQRANLQQAGPGFLFQTDMSSTRPPFIQSPLVELNVPAFLPTPYRPENSVIPTSPTQSEVSTVSNQVSKKMNKFKNNALKNNPLFYDIAEVSTHYPILGTPEAQSEGSTDTPLPINENGEITNEITTQQEIQKQRIRRPTKEPTKSTSTRDPTRSRITNRRRPRPRKPLTTTTTEETVINNYDPIKSQETIEETPTETEKPQRKRRPKPSLYKPRQKVEEKLEELVQNKKPKEDELPGKVRGRYRFRNRERPSTERSDTSPILRKRLRPTFSEDIINQPQRQFIDETTETSIEQEQYSYENYPVADSSYSEENSQLQSDKKEVNTQSQLPDESTQEEPIRQNKPFIEEIHPVTEKMEPYEITRVPPTPTTELEITTLFHVPENEIEDTTQGISSQEEAKDEGSISEAAITTTSEATTTKSNRIRRPSKFSSSNRPRFSVKDYRQRLNPHTSTTPATTTQTQQKISMDNLRLRFPSRMRNRPSPTTASSRVDEESSDETTTTVRSRFYPKEPRHQTTTEDNLIITEKSVVAVNTRLRPFGRSRMTTEATTPAPKISIRPNLFSAKRRNGYPSLRTRIQNKLKKSDTEETEETITSTMQNELEENESLKIIDSVTTDSSVTTANFNINQIISNEDVSTDFDENTTTEDIMKTDALLYSQRVSDLTSSFKDYDKPGVFNSVSPTSRSIPNYFTLSTDDPILPIEAFFPNLKEKERS